MQHELTLGFNRPLDESRFPTKTWGIECLFICQHTAEAIKTEINRMLTEWELKDKALAISSDYVANAINGLALTHIDPQRCFAHTLQIVTHDAISCQRSVNDMLAICRRIAALASTLAHHRLAKILPLDKFLSIFICNATHISYS